MTLNELIYDAWEMFTPYISDDSEYTDRQFAFWIKTYRALAIRNEYNRNRSYDPSVIQDLGCLELEVADRADCCEISDGCTVLRTKNKLPRPIELHHSQAITRVGDIDKLSISYNFVPYETAVYSGNGRYSKKEIFAFWMNDRVYIVSKCKRNLLMTHINVRGIFQDPEEVGKLYTCNNEACYTNDSEYPLNTYMWSYIKSMILEKELRVTQQTIVDGENNAKADNTNEASEVKQVNG